MSIKRYIGIFASLILLAPIATSCQQDNSFIYLKVLNSEDYIYKQEKQGVGNPDMTVQFENFYNDHIRKEGEKKVKVIYDTFDTMENMFNTLKTGKTKYDLICASEYMIQKLVKENLVVPLNIKEKIPNYYNNCSSFINNQLNSIKFKNNDGEERILGEYCIDYMWGTLGIVYNPTYSEFQKRGISFDKLFSDSKSFNILWNNEYNRTISIKDSMRDTYAVGLIHRYQNEFTDPSKTPEERNVIFNRGGEEDADATTHIKEVQDDLLKLRQNIFGFEVDSGKEDICTGKIGLNIAWSGDAVYSINKACNPEETANPFDLYFSIPNEGTNLWFDCWCMQQNDHEDVAYAFLDFLSDADSAIQNMDYIGYTSPIADSENKVFKWFQEEKYPVGSGVTPIKYDVTYFFSKETDGDKIYFDIDPKLENRQMAAQFPKADIIDKLMIMKDYGKNNDLIMKMWEQVKHESLPTWAIIVFSIEGAAILVGIGFIVYFKVKNKRRKKLRLANK